MVIEPDRQWIRDDVYPPQSIYVAGEDATGIVVD